MSKGRRKNRNAGKKKPKKIEDASENTPPPPGIATKPKSRKKSERSEVVDENAHLRRILPILIAAESINKKKLKKTDDGCDCTPWQRSFQIQAEKNIPDESKTEEEKDVLPEGGGESAEINKQDLVEEDSYELRNTIICFILNGIWTVICLFVAIHIIIMVATDGWLSLNFGETTWTTGIVLFLIFVATVASVLLALIELPDFLEYIFKCASIINFFIIVAFTANVFFKSNSVLIQSDETFMKIATWICTIWVTSIITIGISLLITKDPLNSKTQVYTFVNFTSKFAFTFYAVLIILKNISRSNDNNLFGVEFEETFWKFVNSLCYMLVAVLAIGYALYYQYIKW